MRIDYDWFTRQAMQKHIICTLIHLMFAYAYLRGELEEEKIRQSQYPEIIVSSLIQYVGL